MLPVLRCLITIGFGVAIRVSYLNAAEPAVPILVYHRFGASRTDSMTVTTQHSESKWICSAKAITLSFRSTHLSLGGSERAIRRRPDRWL